MTFFNFHEFSIFDELNQHCGVRMVIKEHSPQLTLLLAPTQSIFQPKLAEFLRFQKVNLVSFRKVLIN